MTALTLTAACTGSTHLAKPWASPMQSSTALPDTPYPPRDLAMFDAVNGRVLMWSDLIALSAWADVVVISNAKDDPGGLWMQTALTEDTIAAFPPSACFRASGDAASVVAELNATPTQNRCVLIHYDGPESLPDLSSAIRHAHPGDKVLTLALLPSPARFLRTEDVRKADVVAYTTPTNVVVPSELQPDQPRAPDDLHIRK
jgi:hypothetical protein